MKCEKLVEQVKLLDEKDLLTITLETDETKLKKKIRFPRIFQSQQTLAQNQYLFFAFYQFHSFWDVV